MKKSLIPIFLSLFSLVCFSQTTPRLDQVLNAGNSGPVATPKQIKNIVEATVVNDVITYPPTSTTTVSPTDELIVRNSGVWKRAPVSSFSVAVTNAWLLLGNSGTVDGTNFLGTINEVPLNFRVKNLRAGRITSDAITNDINTSGYGYQSLFSITSGDDNTAIGSSALFENTTGTSNTAIGSSALLSNISGGFNFAGGVNSLVNNTNSNNTAVGYNSLVSNGTGSTNTSCGYQSLSNNTTGTNNSGFGANSEVGSVNLTFATAIGAGAIVRASNTVHLGNASLVAVKTSGNGIIVNQIQSAINSTGSATAAQIVSGYITSTSGAATAITLPSVATLATEIGGTAIRGTSLYFSVDNSAGANTVTITLPASITVNTPVITGGDNLLITTGNSIGLFRIVFTSGTTAKIFRIH